VVPDFVCLALLCFPNSEVAELEAQLYFVFKVLRFFTFSFQLDILSFNKVLGETIIAVQMSYETLLESIDQKTIEKAASKGKRGSMLSICPDDMRRLIMFVEVVDVAA
jgi:hypothetical protein